jgi:hypothetical protein
MVDEYFLLINFISVIISLLQKPASNCFDFVGKV